MTREDAISILERVAHTESKWPGTEDTLEALDMAISSLRQQDVTDTNVGKWISVNDRLPTDEDEMVLAIMSGKPCENITLDGAYELATYIEREGWIVEQYPEWETPEVTFWMLLPEPPEEGTV